MQCWSNQPSQRDSNQMASGKPGAVQSCQRGPKYRGGTKKEEIAQAIAGFALLADHQVRHWLVSFASLSANRLRAIRGI